MRPLLLLACLLGLPIGGCLLPKVGSPDAGPAGPTGGEITIDVDGGTGSTPSTATGTGCAPDPTSNITLCTGTTECPGVTVDTSAFPECGFYINGNFVDLVCVCAGYLCPMGAVTSCASASAVLAAANEATVCGEVTTSSCSLITTTGGSGGTAGSGAADSGPGCDKTCEAMCAGEPDCIEGCGC
jgi:hypothetical protein